jgi:hypothetical protein
LLRKRDELDEVELEEENEDGEDDELEFVPIFVKC